MTNPKEFCSSFGGPNPQGVPIVLCSTAFGAPPVALAKEPKSAKVKAKKICFLGTRRGEESNHLDPSESFKVPIYIYRQIDLDGFSIHCTTVQCTVLFRVLMSHFKRFHLL